MQNPEDRDVAVAAPKKSWQRLASAPVGQSSDQAFVAAFLNPRATIDRVEPLSFRVGEEIDLDIYYTPRCDDFDPIGWQTMVVVKEGSTVLYQERFYHVTSQPGQKKDDANTGKAMPSTPVNLTIEIWCHPDYTTATYPYP